MRKRLKGGERTDVQGWRLELHETKKSRRTVPLSGLLTSESGNVGKICGLAEYETITVLDYGQPAAVNRAGEYLSVRGGEPHGGWLHKLEGSRIGLRAGFSSTNSEGDGQTEGAVQVEIN